MIMFGLYKVDEVPFKDVIVHGMLRDAKGQKMSKSKGNGIDPVEMINKYGADATRMGLVAARDITADWMIDKQQLEERIRGYRNFSNKIWNAARFVKERVIEQESNRAGERTEDFNSKIDAVTDEITNLMEKFRLGQAAELAYDRFWHWYCDECIEKAKKNELSHADLVHGLIIFLKLLHPFMPFVTEQVWEEIRDLRKYPEQMLIMSKWPH
jgi:valyl-tRNA synthetase